MATAREGVWRADRVSPAAAPRLDAEVQLSHPSTQYGENWYRPAIAYNSQRHEYLVVWSAMDTSGGFPGVPSDISSMLLSSTGNIITSRNLTTSTYPQQADVTYNLAKNSNSRFGLLA